MTTVLLAALALGVAGSLHCVAMCGPLVGVVSPVFGRRVAPALLYQAGRVATYTLIGAIAGLAGAAASLAGLGRVLSVVAGLLLLMAGLAARGERPTALARRRLAGLRATRHFHHGLGQATRAGSAVAVWWGRALSGVLGRLASAHRSRPGASALGAGAINGALPCGLVYAAALLAVTTGSPLRAVFVMLAFGVGTAPMMLGVWSAVAIVPAVWRSRFRLLTPAALAIAGVVLLVRGFVVMAAPHAH